MENILIVDADQILNRELKTFFIARGYNVRIARHPKSAVKMARTMNRPVVLLDIAAFPGTQGLDLIGELLEIDPAAKIIILTGSRDEDLARRTLALGAFDYITKPPDLGYTETAVMVGIAMEAG